MIFVSTTESKKKFNCTDADTGGGGGAFPVEHAPFFFCTPPLQVYDNETCTCTHVITCMHLPKCLDLRTCENESTRDGNHMYENKSQLMTMRYS